MLLFLCTFLLFVFPQTVAAVLSPALLLATSVLLILSSAVYGLTRILRRSKSRGNT
jgi:hypothetical protein